MVLSPVSSTKPLKTSLLFVFIDVWCCCGTCHRCICPVKITCTERYVTSLRVMPPPLTMTSEKDPKVIGHSSLFVCFCSRTFIYRPLLLLFGSYWKSQTDFVLNTRCQRHTGLEINKGSFYKQCSVRLYKPPLMILTSVTEVSCISVIINGMCVTKYNRSEWSLTLKLCFGLWAFQTPVKTNRHLCQIHTVPFKNKLFGKTCLEINKIYCIWLNRDYLLFFLLLYLVWQFNH